MKLRDIRDVLTFAAFRPEPDDSAATWRRRFPRRSTLLLNIGKSRTSWRGLGRNGAIVEGGVAKGDFKDLATAHAADWKKLTDDGWCNVSINSRYVISIESNLPRKEGIEDVIRANPRAVLGGKFERTKRYALTNNPEHGTSIVLSCEDEMVKKIEAALAEAGLRAGRICCGAYTILRRLIEHANAEQPSADAAPPPPADFLYVVCCEGSICLLSQTGDMWSDLRSRADFYDEDPSQALEILPSFRREGQSRPRLLFACDQPGSPLPARIAELRPDLEITDLTGPDHLWATISDLC